MSKNDVKISKEYCTLSEVAALIGLNRTTVERHLRAGRLPGRKLGRRWLIRRRVLDQVLDPSTAAQDQQQPAA